MLIFNGVHNFKPQTSNFKLLILLVYSQLRQVHTEAQAALMEHLLDFMQPEHESHPVGSSSNSSSASASSSSFELLRLNISGWMLSAGFVAALCMSISLPDQTTATANVDADADAPAVVGAQQFRLASLQLSGCSGLTRESKAALAAAVTDRQKRGGTLFRVVGLHGYRIGQK